MQLIEQFHDYVRAAFTGLWIQSHEADEAQREIVKHAQRQDWQVALWDIAEGLRVSGRSVPVDNTAGDPLVPLRALAGLAADAEAKSKAKAESNPGAKSDGEVGDEDAEPVSTTLLVLHNFHKFLTNPEVVQALFASLIAGKQQRTFVVVLAPVVQIPVELEKLFVVIEHPLPDRPQLLRIARELTCDKPDDLPKGPDLDRVIDAAAGLTRYEAEGAFALSIARHQRIVPASIWELKAQTLRKNNLLALHRGTETFESLGGLGNVKDFCRRVLRPGQQGKPRGLLLLGVPGSGKSCFAKSLGHETGRPTLLLDVGSLLGSLVGQSEANLRQALAIADAMSPCILFCDEIEKALSGVGGQGDGGVATRLFGYFLTWLSDHESNVFVIATANDITRLPPEFSRAERFDGVFFVDLPGRAEKDAIWTLYRRQYGTPATQTAPDDSNWTGAEIRSCCRLAALLDVPLTQAARNVVPVAVTAAESVEKLRTWASGRCLSASEPGIYARDGQQPPRPSRRVQRGQPNQN